jgi:hypothetical protein
MALGSAERADKKIESRSAPGKEREVRMPTKTKENGTGILAPDVEPALQKFLKSVREQSTEDLKKELAALLGFPADNLMKLAIVVQELENRGENLTGLKIGILPLLRKIASGTLLPEIVVIYAGNPALIKTIALKPIVEQQRILEQGLITESTGCERLGNVGKARHSDPRKNDHDYDPDKGECHMPNIDRIAEQSSPKDIGEMAAQMILKCSNTKVAVAVFNKIVAKELK